MTYTRQKRSRAFSDKDRQLLALNVAAAEKIVAQPELVDTALAKLEARYAAGTIRHSVYIGWFVILELVTLNETQQFLDKVAELSPHMQRLRRRSPLIGLTSNDSLT